MDSSSSPAPPGLGAGPKGDHSEDQEMTDAPSHTYTKSQFVLPSSAATSPEPHSNNDQTSRVLETTEKPSIPLKKKGQAAVKKAPKRGKGGTNGSKATKKPVKKVAASDASVDSAAEAEGEADAADSDEGDESDNGPYCICRGPDDHRFMIGCDVCEDWFHGECVGIDKDVGEHLIERFVCPNCSNRDEGVLTVFKKTCGLPKCNKPARLYDGQPTEERSHYCSDEHKQLWWERLLATLPKKKNPSSKVPEPLTQSEFVAILESGLAIFQNDNNKNNSASGLPTEDEIMTDPIDEERAKGQEEPQAPEEQMPKPPEGQEPVLGEDQAEPMVQVNKMLLTPEQQQLLNQMSSERQAIAQEIFLYYQMNHTVEWAMGRRKKLVAAEMLDDAACGYDYRLDHIGTREPFKKWLHSDDGRALFEGVPHGMGAAALGPNVPLSADPKDVCDKKRCKAHQGWYALLKRDIKLDIHERSAVINDHLKREESIENAARERFKRMERAKAACD